MFQNLIILFTFFTFVFLSSCNESPEKSQFGTEPCRKVFDASNFSYEKLKGYSTSELLTIQRCGLAIRPQRQLSWFIANQETYPIPEILNILRKENDEEFALHLIIDIVAVFDSEVHRAKAVEDSKEIIDTVESAVGKINNSNLKNLSNIEFDKIRKWDSRIIEKKP